MLNISEIVWSIASWFNIRPPCKCGEVLQPNPKDKRGDKTCEFFIPTVDMYGRWNGKWGMCSNKKRFGHAKTYFSIYDHIVCWTINLNDVRCECIDCAHYKYQSLINRKLKLARSILKMWTTL
jgi:hypothetical protein